MIGLCDSHTDSVKTELTKYWTGWTVQKTLAMASFFMENENFIVFSSRGKKKVAYMCVK